ncbi:MAG: hypothetical protein Q8907_08050 [Bacteroidota bacterium]|nr:hypothetical protein [Bacteroidota bacterium]MDP4225147.1 hypothetical protein [Bacteroidota bacterium]MDP4274214.1 hypothetical protein [Bacteroidota bacterium]
MQSNNKPDDLDKWIDEAIRTAPDIDIPDSFCDKLVSKVEKRMAWQRLIVDFGMKVLLIIFALAILGLTLFFSFQSKSGSDKEIVAFLSHNCLLISEILLCLTFTFFVDQVVMKFLNRKMKRL